MRCARTRSRRKRQPLPRRVSGILRNVCRTRSAIGPVKYAMVADIKREIQKAYGIEHPDEGVALRGSFLIDANGIVRHQVVNDLPLPYAAFRRCYGPAAGR